MDEWKDLEFPIGQQGNKVSFVSALFRTTFIRPIHRLRKRERERAHRKDLHPSDRLETSNFYVSLEMVEFDVRERNGSTGTARVFSVSRDREGKEGRDRGIGSRRVNVDASSVYIYIYPPLFPLSFLLSSMSK